MCHMFTLYMMKNITMTLFAFSKSSPTLKHKDIGCWVKRKHKDIGCWVNNTTSSHENLQSLLPSRQPMTVTFRRAGLRCPPSYVPELAKFMRFPGKLEDQGVLVFFNSRQLLLKIRVAWIQILLKKNNPIRFCPQEPWWKTCVAHLERNNAPTDVDQCRVLISQCVEQFLVDALFSKKGQPSGN